MKAALISAVILGFTNSAQAEDIFESASINGSITALTAPHINSQSAIAVARLDGGRLIPAPYGELEDWTFLDNRLAMNITPLSAASHIKYTPEIPFTGQDTDNKIDEIRLTAANEGMDFTLIYAVGPDADFDLFGHRSLEQTGLSLTSKDPKWEKAKSRAVLVNSFTGDVLGMVTADNVEYNIGELADKAGELIENLSVIKTASRTTISG
jgi:hypothetical protein